MALGVISFPSAVKEAGAVVASLVLGWSCLSLGDCRDGTQAHQETREADGLQKSQGLMQDHI